MLLTGVLLAQKSNQVIIYGEELEPQNQSKNIIVLDEEQIKKTQAKTLPEVLSNVPGVNITSYGKYQNSSIYMKGASPHSTIILLNGIKLQDASGGAFDIGQIPLVAIQRIEIIENGDGVSYGSNASAGVINIITKKAQSKNDIQANLEGGSRYSNYEEFGYLTKSENNDINFVAFVANNSSKGYSLAYPSSSVDESDGFNKQSVLLNYSYKKLDVLFNYNLSNVQTDPFVYSTNSLFDLISGSGEPKLLDSANYNDVKESYNGYIKYNQDFLGLSNKFSASFYSTNKVEEVVNLNTFLINDLLNQNFDYKNSNDYKGNVFSLSYLGSTTYLSNGYVNFGADYDYSQIMQTNHSLEFGLDQNQITQNNISKSSNNDEQYYGVSTIVGYRFFQVLNINAGLRYNDYINYDLSKKLNYNVSADYIFLNNYKLRANYTSNFKAPNLFELYDNNFGNEKLKEEQTQGFDVGVDASFFNEKTKASITYFNQHITNLITLDYSSKGQVFINSQNKINSQGVILYNTNNINKYLDLIFSYTYLNFDEIVARRPKHTFSSQLQVNPIDKLTLNLEYLYVGNFYDGFEGTGFYQLTDYHIINAKMQYDFSQKLSGYLRGTNLLNQKYQPAYSFASEGIGVYIGVIWK